MTMTQALHLAPRHRIGAAGFGRKELGRRIIGRASAPLPAFYTTRGRSGQAALLDLSSAGARIQGEDLPAKGEELVLTVGRLRSFATVAWSIRGQCGLIFDSRIPLEEVARIRSRAAEHADVAPEIVAALDDWTTGFAR